MQTFLHKLAVLIAAPLLALFASAGHAVPASHLGLLGATNPIESPVALFETSLASGITSSQTTMTLVSATTLDGTTLASSTYGFIIDQGTASQELVEADCTSTACTNMSRGLSSLDGTTTVAALQFSHRRGASVKMTDAPLLLKLTRILNGIGTFPNVLSYTSAVSISTSSNNIPTAAWVAGVGGTASTSARSTLLSSANTWASLQTLTSGLTSNGTATFNSTTNVPYSAASSSAASVGYVTDAALGHLTSFTFVNSTTTNATTTNSFITNASTTNSTTTNAYITNLVAASCTGCGSNAVYAGFGSDGSDGVGTISANATATRDMYYTTLTVNSGVTYNTAGYKIFAQVSITNNGTITNSGGNGVVGSGGLKGTGGTGGGAGSVPGGRAGGNGNDRGANNGVAGTASSYNLVDQSCAAGGGGGGGSVTGAGSGGAAGSNSISVQTPRNSFGAFNLTGFTTAGASTTVYAFNTNCGAGGAGGGGIGDGSVGGGGGGGAGGSGGVVWLAAPTITNSATGIIKSTGGNGGAGESSASTGAGGGGGGGGGNGGAIFLLYSTLTNSGSIVATAGSAGAAGTGQMNNGVAGGAGNAGVVIQIKNN